MSSLAPKSLLYLLAVLPHTLGAPFAQTPEDIPSGGIGYDPSAQGDEDAGNDGADTGAVSLSKGAIIAISIVAFLVIVGGISLAVLFYISKRRQWRLAETLRRSVKRVGTGLQRVMTPRTPHKMTFSPVLEKRNRNGSAAVLLDDDRNPGSDSAARGGDREKGLSTVSEEGAGGSGSREGRKTRKPPPVTVPQSKFEMDSPKTPLWSKVFGR